MGCSHARTHQNLFLFLFFMLQLTPLPNTSASHALKLPPTNHRVPLSRSDVQRHCVKTHDRTSEQELCTLHIIHGKALHSSQHHSCLWFYNPVLTPACLFFLPSARPVSQTTVDTEELRRFQNLAGKWWDEQGEFAALHAMNDLRVPFIRCVCMCTCTPMCCLVSVTTKTGLRLSVVSSNRVQTPPEAD